MKNGSMPRMEGGSRKVSKHKTDGYKGPSTEANGTKPKSSNTKQSTTAWRPIRGLERYYQVSCDGRVRSRNAEVKPRLVRKYLYVMLQVADGEFRFRRNVAVHRLVAQEFCPNRLKRKQVNHKDGNKLNNHFTNLEWVSRKENMRHAVAMGLMKSPSGNPKFTPDQIAKVFELRKKDYKHREIAEALGMGQSTVTHILLGTRRKNHEARTH